MIYYGQRRAVLDVPQRIRGSSKQTPEAAFSEALKLGDLNFREFVAWFRDRSLMEAQHWQSDQSYLDPQLEAVRRAMSQATGLESPHFRVGVPSGLCVRKNGMELRVDQLSSGERSFLSLAGDLGRRLAMLNPQLDNPLKGLGIVLIDEIELHLHPRWQRKIVPWLLRTFPNCQFVVSTHSPQVLGRVHAQNIQALRVEGGETHLRDVSAAYGRDSNYILLSVLGGDERDEDLKNELDSLDRAIAIEDLDGASKILNSLRSKIEGSPPELTLAQARLERRRRDRAVRNHTK
jgi:predicted ATP-binding protein involved in virulence